MKSKTSRGYLLNTVIVVVLFIGFQILTSLKGSEGSFKLVIVPSIWQCCYLMVLAASLNLVLGFMGQLSLGHCGFMAIGAYTAALLSLACERAGLFENKSDLSFLLVLIASVLAAGILAALLSFLIGIPALRLKGDYLAIITLGFGMIIINIINNLPFCGQDGLAQGSAAASLYKNGLGFGSKAKVQFLWFALVVTILSIGSGTLFYKEVHATKENGMIVLHKVYGPVHTVFYVLLGFYFVLSFSAILYSFFFKKQVSRRIIWLLFFPEVVTMVVFFGGR